MFTRVLANGWTLAAARNVKVPSGAGTMSARRPPGFMNAICAPPTVSGVAQRWTSATRLPRVDSPPRFSVLPLLSLARLNGAWILPSAWAPRTFATASASATMAAVAGSAGKFGVQTASPLCSGTIDWLIPTSSPVSVLNRKLRRLRL